MTKASIKRLQRELNTFTKKYLRYVAPLRVDGDLGAATKKRIKVVKYYLGYPASERNSIPGQRFRYRLRHPKRPWRHDKTWQVRAAKRRIEQRIRARKDHKATAALAHKNGFATFDGKTVAAWMVPWLQKSRAHGWSGWVVSGVRTPSYSRYLCIRMCGAPSCPGRCAGLNSNHNMLASQGKPHGALDVSDYARFGRIQREIGSPLINRLGPRDPVHFSVSGN